MIKTILNKIAFDEKESAFYNESKKQHETVSILSDGEFNKVNDYLKSLLPFSNINDYNFSFAPCATDLITELFNKYVDEDTLILTTKSEHPNVKKLLNKYKNVEYVYDKMSLQNFKIDKKFKRVFVYMISTLCATGTIIYDFEMQSVIDKARSSGKEVITVIDAVQELFLLPRDYSQYDYIIGTSHVLIPDFDMGIVLSKDSSVGKRLAVSKVFSELLSLLMKRKEFLYQFNMIMNIEFGELKNSPFKAVSNVNHLYFIQSECGEFDGITKDDIVLTDSTYKGVILKGCWAVVDPKSFLKLFNTVKLITKANI